MKLLWLPARSIYEIKPATLIKKQMARLGTQNLLKIVQNNKAPNLPRSCVTKLVRPGERRRVAKLCTSCDGQGK